MRRRCSHVIAAGVKVDGRWECAACHFERLAIRRRRSEWLNTWGVGLLLTGSIVAAIVGGVLTGGWLGLRSAAHRPAILRAR